MDFDIDKALSSFGETSKAASKGSFDVDKVLSEFGVKSEPLPESIKKVIINTNPQPPISGVSKEASDELNQTRIGSSAGENPRALLPTTNIGEKAYEADLAGKDLVSSGVEDFGAGHPYKGTVKVIGGALSRLASPLTGILEGGINKLATDVTGSPDFGDKASFIAGSIIPIVPGGGAVVKAIPKNKALSILVENIGKDNIPAVVSAMKANPRLAPADLSPRVLQDTQHLFANEGPQIDYLAKTSGARVAGSKDAVTSAYDASAGTPVNVVQKLNELAIEAKRVGNEKINPAIKSAGPVDISKTLEAIDTTLKPGVLKVGDSVPLTAVKKELENIRKSLRTSKEYKAEDLHSFQAGLRRTAESLLKSATGGDREMGGALMNVRNNLVSDIDKASGGKYKPALSSYRDEMHIADSFRDGYEGIFSNSKKMENRPEFTKQWFDGLTNAEKEAAREGARTAIHTEIGVAKNGALSGTNLAKSDFNKEKLEIVFGKEEAKSLIRKLEDERAIANTHNKIVEGSQTAMRIASKSQFAMPDKTEVMKSAPMIAAAEGANFFYGGFPGAATGAAILAKGGAAIKDKIATALAREHNVQYAKYALPTEGPSRDALIKSLEAAIPTPKLGLRSKLRLSNLVSNP